ncbi:DUF4148 domain-containing protein [Trinickia fusca]|uniref:DUF4148 domain-containing protein n=1 Tax=Trinickia fusca TaxID=2419777 RepID=A0A494X0N6_9BURK|nr:DUF4148 domain-containing protein [Trinickia fusca]RKP43862.1 DUF4148 domain-containing protein [Trinickia fusca]
MKTILSAVLLSCALAAPAVSFAEANQPVTRAQVGTELKQLEDAGYRPSGNDTVYPADIQAAQQRVQAQNAQGNTTGYGSQAGGASQSGARDLRGPASIYFGA